VKRAIAIVAAAGVLVIGATGCYSAGDATDSARQDCQGHGGVRSLNYSDFWESAVWVCRDGKSGGHDQ
jgi:hypothetical protein